MNSAAYYRARADQAKRLRDNILDKATERALDEIAREFTEIAEDLESGAPVIRHSERMLRRATDADRTATDMREPPQG
jgi:hypothetical protein